MDEDEVMNPREAALRRFARETGFGGDLELLREAVTHSSYANEAGSGIACNERLEFLGDSVLGVWVSRGLFRAHPQLPEGMLSRLRASIVNEVSLAEAARAMDLGALLRLGKGEERTGGREKTSVLGDAFEAVLGALFLADGLEAAGAFVDRHFAERVRQPRAPGAHRDYKTRLQEAAQRVYATSPIYEPLDERGPDHEREFHVRVLIDGRAYGTGLGSSKKRAQREAARVALERIEAEESG